GRNNSTQSVQRLSCSSDLMNREPSKTNIDLDPNDTNKVLLYATTDEYRQLLEYIHKLYDEVLIEQSIFSIEWGQSLANASDNLYAGMIFYDPIELFGEEIGSQYNRVTALEGPEGYKECSKYT